MEHALALTPNQQAAAVQIFNRVVALLPPGPRPWTGALYQVYVIDGDQLVRTSGFIMGELPGDLLTDCDRESSEKAYRLARNWQNMSSAESESVDDGKRGGAIRGNLGPCRIFSMAGLSQFGNEAAMLLLAREVGDLDAPEAFAIAVTSGNDIYVTLAGPLG